MFDSQVIMRNCRTIFNFMIKRNWREKIKKRWEKKRKEKNEKKKRKKGKKV